MSHATTAQGPPEPARALRQPSRVCVNAESGVVWWAENSKEAHANGIFDACDRWARSRHAGAGARAGFPKFKKRCSDSDRYRITTGALRLDGPPSCGDPAGGADAGA